MTLQDNNILGLEKGDKVILSTRNGDIFATFSHVVHTTRVFYFKGDDGKAYERKNLNKVTIQSKSGEFVVSNPMKLVKSSIPETKIVQNSRFDINKRFSYLEAFVRMVIKRTRVSLIITGEGGLGKTYTVKEQIALAGLKEFDPETGEGQYKYVKGFSTARGLYKLLFEHRDRLIIFDDCDEVLEDKIAKNILKGALDSYDKRVISWITNKENPDVPNEFEFTGAIIFVSNINKNRMDQALQTRSTCVDVSMTVEDKLTRMEVIVRSGKFKTSVTLEEKLVALEIIKEFAMQCKALSMRTLIEVIDYKTSGEENWEELAEYAMVA